MITAREISKMLAERVLEVVEILIPGGKRSGNEYMVGDVTGGEGRSCRVHVTGPKAGVWADFAGSERGDLLDLWSKSKGISLLEAIKEAKSYLGISDTEWRQRSERKFSRPTKPKCVKPDGEVSKYLTETRKLSEKAIEVYKIAQDGENIIFPYLRCGELMNVKRRSFKDKKMQRVEKDCEPCLFGWQAIPADAREVVICEGEIDALTLFDCGFPALSVPFGGGGAGKQNWIEHELENLARFDTIYVCMDMDKEGLAAVQEIIPRLGRCRCRVVKLPAKDANECITSGLGQIVVKAAIRESKTLDPVELKPAITFSDEVFREFYPRDGQAPGFPAPWSYLGDKVRFRPAELSVWTGINGHGKSLILNQIILAAADAGQNACIASLEVKPKRTLYRMVRQVTGVTSPTQEYFSQAMNFIGLKIWMVDFVGTMKRSDLLETFTYAYQRYGITQFVIDSLMKCGIAEDDYNEQKAFVDALCSFKNEYGVHVHLVAHARKGESEEKLGGKLDVKGTGAITDLADNCFLLWRNKKKEDEVRRCEVEGQAIPDEVRQKADAVLVCDKQRNGEWEGKVRLNFHRDSFQFLDFSQCAPRQYFEFSSKIQE